VTGKPQLEIVATAGFRRRADDARAAVDREVHPWLEQRRAIIAITATPGLSIMLP
jgi:hypothetical protein